MYAYVSAYESMYVYEIKNVSNALVFPLLTTKMQRKTGGEKETQKDKQEDRKTQIYGGEREQERERNRNRYKTVTKTAR